MSIGTTRLLLHRITIAKSGCRAAGVFIHHLKVASMPINRHLDNGHLYPFHRQRQECSIRRQRMQCRRDRETVVFTQQSWKLAFCSMQKKHVTGIPRYAQWAQFRAAHDHKGEQAGGAQIHHQCLVCAAYGNRPGHHLSPA